MINLIQGNSADFDVVVYVNSEILDITLHKIWFTAKINKSDSDEDALIQVTSEDDNITITDGPSGEFRISLTPEQTQALPLDTVIQCDVQLRTPDDEGKVYTLLFEEITVSERVTKSLDLP